MIVKYPPIRAVSKVISGARRQSVSRLQNGANTILCVSILVKLINFSICMVIGAGVKAV